jgi:hypothetical protein
MSCDDECAVDEIANSLKGGFALEAGGTGYGPIPGMDLGAPFGAESVCDLAENDGGSDFALGDIVGGRDLAIGKEGEELRSPRRTPPV